MNLFQAQFDPSANWTAQLELKSDGFAYNGWLVDWVRITTEEHLEFNCPVNVWLKRELVTNDYVTETNVTCYIVGKA